MFVVLNLFLRIVYDFLWYKVVFFMACTHRASVILELCDIYMSNGEKERKKSYNREIFGQPGN